MKPYFAVIALFLLQASGLSSTWYVPDDFSTIQEAIDAAVDGDVIIVRAAVYREAIDFLGKEITVQSELGPDQTIINGSQLGSVVSFKGGEGPGAVLEGFTISNGSGANINYNYYGGGIYCCDSSPTIRGNIIRLISTILYGNPWETGYGGGIWCYGSSALIEDNTISENFADRGGGISSSNSCLTIINNTVSKNSATQFGGGLRCGLSLISGNIITENEADSQGGGVYCSLSTLTDNVISENTVGFNGGGIFAGSGTIIENTRISRNTSTGGSGGGIAANSGSPPTMIRFNMISENSASRSGGGIFGDYHSDLIITDCLILNNYASDYGGGINSLEGITFVTNCTFQGNMATRGGGIAVQRLDSTIVTNSVLWNNEAPVGSEICLASIDQFDFPTLSITASNVKGGLTSVHVDPGCTLLWGTGMIDADPLCVQPELDDFHLTYDSPCRDTGIDSAPGLPDEDFEGDPRIAGFLPDMGADEFHRHLYSIGDAVPGGSIDFRIVGPPAATPVWLGHGRGILDPPRPTIFGDLFLKPPVVPLGLGPIPVNGVLIHTATVPDTWIPGEGHPFQTLIGQELSNLMVLTVQSP